MTSMTIGNRLPVHRNKWEMPKWMYPVVYHKWHILIAVVMIALLIGFVGVGFAAEDESAINCVTWNTGFIKGMMKEITSSSSDSEVNDMLMINASTLTYTSGGKTIGTQAGQLVHNTLYPVFKIVGEAMVIIYWSMSFYALLMRSSHLEIEQLARKFAMLALGMIVVVKADTIFNTCIEFGNYLTGYINVSKADYTIKNEMYAEIHMQIHDKNTFIENFKAIGTVIKLLIPYVLSVLCSLGMKFFCIARYIEICAMAAICPVMFCDISNADNGFIHSNAVRGIKNILVLAMQSVMIMLAVSICGALAASVVSDGTAGANDYLNDIMILTAIAVAKLGVTAKSQSLARTMLGM